MSASGSYTGPSQNAKNWRKRRRTLAFVTGFEERRSADAYATGCRSDAYAHRPTKRTRSPVKLFFKRKPANRLTKKKQTKKPKKTKKKKRENEEKCARRYDDKINGRRVDDDKPIESLYAKSCGRLRVGRVRVRTRERTKRTERTSRYVYFNRTYRAEDWWRDGRKKRSATCENCRQS